MEGQEEKSGGIATNIGVHFFDMLSWIFGNVKENVVHINAHDRATGYLELEKAKVRWFLSINDLLPNEVKALGQRTFRSIVIDGEEYEFSDGFSDLHTRVYEDIIAGGGCGIEDVSSAIEIIPLLRTQIHFRFKR